MVDCSRVLGLIFLLTFGGLLPARAASVPTIGIEEIKAGMRGTGRTVFRGTQPEEFQVEVLGVLENIGPKQSIILAKLSGGPLERTGVMQGMSGSPVYIGGRLAGAVALTFAFSKDPIAGIRPIREMLEVERQPARPATRIARMGGTAEPLAALSKPEDIMAGQSRLIEISTPVSFNGFTRSTVERFSKDLRTLGLEPVQGVSTGNPTGGFGDPSLIQPGSMISVQLLSGDMSVGAEGTVTHVDGRNIYGFGHRFLSVGSTDLPFARAEVLALLPNVATSFKISAAREWMGTITQDRSVGIAGTLGRKAEMVPFTVSVNDPESKSPRPMRYEMRMVNDRALAPLLVQMALYSAIEATERTLGTGSFRVTGKLAFEGSVPPIQLNNVYSGDFNVPLMVSLGAAVPLSYVMQSGFDALKLKNIEIQVEASDRKKQNVIDQVWTSVREVRPGDSFDILALLSGENGAEITRTVRYTVPVGASPGPIFITVADGSTTNLNEYQQYIGTSPKSPSQLITFLNSSRPNNKAYVRLWRADTAFTVQGQDLPDAPPSLAMLLAKTQQSFSGGLWRGSRMAEFELPAGDSVVTGSKTIQVDVKE
jgi:hypothetical protein